MRFVLSGLGFLLWLFMIALMLRIVLDWVRYFVKGWQPRGLVLAAAEGVYTVTDPPLKAVRRVIPPLRLGNFGFDLAFMVLFFAVMVASSILGRF